MKRYILSKLHLKGITKRSLLFIWRYCLPLPKRAKQRLKTFILANIDKRNPPLGLTSAQIAASEDAYTPYRRNASIDPVIKAVAFYLPQFHPFEENDRFWGKGFTEWTNVTNARPFFPGHHQPRLPRHFGFYDLRVPKVMEQQAALAKEYGIYGFCYHFYWFDGRTVMETPLQIMLKNPAVDMPFFLNWANENWTRRWDGQENDVLIAQKHSLEDSRAFIHHVMAYFRDKRYIKIDGKPVLMVYRRTLIPNLKETVSMWQKELQKAGFPGLYLIAAQTFGDDADPTTFGFDAACAYPPHMLPVPEKTHQVPFARSFEGKCYDYTDTATYLAQQPLPAYPYIPTAMLAWDNTARKKHKSHIFTHFTLATYKKLLSALCNKVFHNPGTADENKFVFINAWNEWAEGTYLEPDDKYNYGYLQTTYDVLEDYGKSAPSPCPPDTYIPHT